MDRINPYESPSETIPFPFRRCVLRLLELHFYVCAVLAALEAIVLISYNIPLALLCLGATIVSLLQVKSINDELYESERKESESDHNGT